MNRLGDSGVNRLGDTSAVVNLVQLLLTRWGKIRMDSVGIVFEFYMPLFKLPWLFQTQATITFHISRYLVSPLNVLNTYTEIYA